MTDFHAMQSQSLVFQRNKKNNVHSLTHSHTHAHTHTLAISGAMLNNLHTHQAAYNCVKMGFNQTRRLLKKCHIRSLYNNRSKRRRRYYKLDAFSPNSVKSIQVLLPTSLQPSFILRASAKLVQNYF